MKRLLVLPLLFLCFGCSHNYYNVPVENFADKVRVLGVAPIIVDATSDINHPQKELLLPLLAEMNRKHEQQLVRKIKGSENFYTVALLDGDPQRIFDTLFFRREKRDDATIQYNKYFWKKEELRDYIRKNNLDAVMLIVVSGLTKTDRIFSGDLLESMTSEYNYLIMTAQILDANATVLWEYPNFRRRLLTYYPMINLQYPDFSEAEANLSTAANVKFKTIEGIKRSFEQKHKDIVFRQTQESEVYGKQFEEMSSFLKYDPDKEKKVTPPASVVEAPPAPAVEVPKPADPVPAPAAAPPKPPVAETVPAEGGTP